MFHWKTRTQLSIRNCCTICFGYVEMFRISVEFKCITLISLISLALSIPRFWVTVTFLSTKKILIFFLLLKNSSSTFNRFQYWFNSFDNETKEIFWNIKIIRLFFFFPDDGLRVSQVTYRDRKPHLKIEY